MSASSKIIRTTCPYCGTGCGIKATVSASGEVGILGDEEHPANFGRLCIKGATLAETLTLNERLLHPRIFDKRASWREALAMVAGRFREAIQTYGPSSVAFYVSGQMLTEDYYVANKLMKGYIGSANIDTNSRLCMASTVAGHKRAFGADIVPNVYEDLELSDLVVLVGSNLAWCHPVLFQRLENAKAARPEMRVVNVDPRRTATSEISDLQLSIAPGSDVALFLGLLRHLDRSGKCDASYVALHTHGFDDALAIADSWDIASVAKATGIEEASLQRFYELYAENERVVTVYSQGVNQSIHGTDKVNAILNCHLATGRIGKPGAGPFSVTGQPNAMGGREVGGLANQLACHMELHDPRHQDIVRRYWRSPTIATKPGLKAIDLFKAVSDGTIKALWIIGTNPADSLPDADSVKAALASCPFVVVSDVVERTDTSEFAHVLLPARAWGEKDGTVTNSERRISRQRPLRQAPGETMPDWWSICRVAKLMGYSRGFDYGGPHDIFREYAGLSGHLNNGSRDFDISDYDDISQRDYDSLSPFQWPRRKGSFLDRRSPRFFANGGFFTPDGRARLIATPFHPPKKRGAGLFTLNTGRIRDQWHTMTRTGVAPSLSRHIVEPFVEIHPADARALDILPASLARLSNAHGSVILRALVTDRQRRGSLFAPIHWTQQNSSCGRIDALVGANTDPISGQPNSKGAFVGIEPWPAAWFGFALTRNKPSNVDAGYWALARTGFGWRMELAGLSEPEDFEKYARELFGVTADSAIAIARVEDFGRGAFRFLAHQHGRALGLLIVSREPVEAARAFLCEKFASHDPKDLMSLLAARPLSHADCGRTVCICHGVGAKEIEVAIDGRARTVETIGRATRAGTGCGSCRPEIQRLINEKTSQAKRAMAPAEDSPQEEHA
ncbi:nitrate reductase [Methylocystis sp. JR02]|uniref:nitrate reductase n=1 Tax=Methylocystis sp. JR02 TaxID=3046284 RepID=UPI0024B8C68A|nr:nitrate reductase [Methylocystis sp. JR02]MDJ0450717.1 nitrate reductase [Methylocystis sp. JR02]